MRLGAQTLVGEEDRPVLFLWQAAERSSLMAWEGKETKRALCLQDCKCRYQLTAPPHGREIYPMSSSSDMSMTPCMSYFFNLRQLSQKTLVKQ